MFRFQTKKNRKGFTLAELLVTVAITVILASFGFVSAARYQKRLKLAEMDNAAREIFIAAQNHLTASEADGSWNQAYQKNAASSDFGVPVSRDTLVLSGTDSDDYRAILSVRNQEPSEGPYAAAWNEILPYGAITESIRTDGQYIVIYNASSASVYGVLYTDNSSSYFSSSDQNFVFDLSELKSYLELVHGSNDTRLSYDGKVFIGWYGGAESASISGGTKAEPSVYFDNAEVLKLNFVYPNSGKDYDHAVLKFTGMTSKAEAVIKVSKSGEITAGSDDSKTIADRLNQAWKSAETGSFRIILDDLTEPARAFGYLFNAKTAENTSGAFLPGEDITVTAYAVKADGTQSAEVSASANSLFESNDGQKLTISNARHLQNLDQSVSGIRKSSFASLQSAELTRDIVWKNDSASFIGLVSQLKKNQSVPSEFNIYGADGSSVRASSAFCSIENDFLTSFEGNDHILRGFSFGPGKSGNAGLFAENPNTGKSFQVQNLFFREASAAAGTSGDAGILVGRSTNGLKISQVFLDGTISVHAASGCAGGLIGKVIEPGAEIQADQRDLIITHSAIGNNQPSDLTVQGKESAGGFAGSISRSNVYLGSESLSEKQETNGLSISVTSMEISSDTASGGLIGEEDSISRFAIRYVKVSAKSYASITSNQGAAGGIAGSISSEAAAEIQISDSSFRSRTNKDNDLTPDKIEQVAGSTAAGGFIGSLSAANGTVIITDSFSNTYVRSSGNGSSAGGFIGSVSSGSGSLTIERAYAAGRTKEAKFQDGIGGQGSYNIFSPADNSFAGGFIGSASGSLTIRSSFSNASVSASGTNSIAAGFIAALNGNQNVTLTGCYSAGKIFGTDHSGSFFGTNASGFTASSCFVLKGSDFNESISAVLNNQANSNTDGIISAGPGTANTPFAVEEKSRKPASPNDSKLGSAYPFMTTSQLNAVYFSGSAYDENPNDNQYFGDFLLPGVSKIAIVAENGNKLTVHFAVPKGTEKFTIGVKGEDSGKTFYCPVQIDTDGTIHWVNFLTYHYNTNVWTSDGKVSDDFSNISNTNAGEHSDYSQLYSESKKDFQKAIDAEKKAGNKYGTIGSPLADDNSEFFALVLDDLTVYGHQFSDMFSQTGMLSGENITVSVVLGWNNSFEIDKSSGVYVNSLFDDGSKQSDHTALIANSRHLENLDEKLAGIEAMNAKSYFAGFTIAKQTDNIHWNTDNEALSKSRKGTIAFAEELKNPSSGNVSVYSWYYFQEKPLASDSSFVPIQNQSLQEYDGNHFSIENLTIDLHHVHDWYQTSGIFSELGAQNHQISVHDLSLNNITSISDSAEAGGLVGKVTNGSFSNVSLTGSSSVSSLNDKSAGGLIGSSVGKLVVSNCTVTTDNFSILTVNDGSAGGLVGSAANEITINNSSVSGNGTSITAQKSGSSGGIIGSADQNLSMTKCTVSGDNYRVLVMDGGSAGGLVGTASNALAINDSSVSGDVISIAAQKNGSSGGLVGSAHQSLSMSNCFIYGNQASVSGNGWGKSAGGLIGELDAGQKKVTISNSQSALLINVAGDGNGGNNAGGLIGGISNAGAGSSITTSQSGGHTQNGSYSTTDFNIDLPYQQSNAGGLIGAISGSQLDVRYCYSTMSVYASQYAGGFIGQVSGGTVNVNNCYSTGLVGAGSAKGSFAGSIVNNSLSGTDNYYLNGINDSWVKPIGNGSSRFFSVEGKDEGTLPFSNQENISAIKFDETVSVFYPYQAYTTINGSVRHVGDWPESKGISVNNGNVLSVKIRLSDFHYSYFTDDLRIAIFGESSKKETFLFLRKISDNSFYVTKYGDDFSWDYDADSGTVTLILDDISAERGSRRFAKQFPDFIPGEDLEIVADYNSTATFINDYRSNPSYYRVKTNSLFGDGSFNSRYDASTYSSSAASIAEKYGLNGNYSDTALILNTRHLENLSYDVSLYSESNLGKVNLAHAKQICDIDVSEFFRQVKEKHVYFDNTISDDSTFTVAKWTDDSRLIGIINDDLQSYDGGGHQISNLSIGNTLYYTMQDQSNSQLDSEIGMFACLLQHASSRDFSISDLTLVNPNLSGSSSTDAGALIGKVYSGNNVTISKVSVISEDDAFSEINGAHAGGLIGVSEKSSITIKDSSVAGRDLSIAGQIDAGGLIGSASGSDHLTFSISNSSATAYVQQSADSVSDSVYSAGGLIGSLSWNGNASITNSYAGGHTSEGNYLDKIDSAEVGRVNVYSANGTAGGLIGYQSGNLSIDKCFSAASVGSGSGYAAGLIGFSTNLSSDAPVSILDSYSAGKIVKLSDQAASEILNAPASTGDWNQYLTFSNVRYLSSGSGFSSITWNGSAASDTGSKLPSSINVDELKALASEENKNNAENSVCYDDFLNGEGQTGSYPYPVYTTVEVTGSDGTVLNQRTYFGDWTETENASAKVNFFIEEVPEDESEFFSSEEVSPSPEASAGASAESTETPEASASADADADASPSASAETEPIESPAPASSAGAMNTEEEASPSPSAGGGTAVPYVHALKLSYPLLKEEETEEPSGTSEPSAASESSEGVETEAGDLVTEEDNMMTIARTVEVGKTVSLSPIHPVQDGYTLVGWRLVDSAEDEANTGSVSLEVMDGSGNQGAVHYDYDPDAVVTVQGDMNLKAVFVRNDLLSFGNTWTSSASAAYNPYPGNTDNCTWTAWQLVYETMGLRLPAWGDAGYWLIRAKAAGFTVSSEPSVHSLVVFSNHVGFVTDVSEDGQMVYIREGNYSGMYHEGWWPAYGDRHGQKRYGYIWLSGSGESNISEEEIAEMESDQAAREEAETEQKETEETIVISDGYYVGNNETALLQDLAEKGLSVGTRSEAYSNTAEAGTIIAHDSGTFAKGAAVNYTVSLGKEQVTEETAEPSLTPEASASASASSVPSASASASAPAPSVSEITETAVPSASASAPAPSVSEITVTAAPAETSEPVNTPVPSVTEIEASPSAAASSAPTESAPVPSVKEIVPAASETPSASASGEE